MREPGASRAMDRQLERPNRDRAHPGGDVRRRAGRGRAESSVLVPQVTVEVADVDAVHGEAVRRGAEVVYPLTDESWGVRRFFLRDPNGVIINVMRHVLAAARE